MSSQYACSIYTQKLSSDISPTTKALKIGGITVNKLRYADDTVLLADNEEELQDIMDKINEVRISYGKKINAKKTKTMVIARDTPPPQMNITRDGSNIEQVQKATKIRRTESAMERLKDVLKLQDQTFPK